MLHASVPVPPLREAILKPHSLQKVKDMKLLRAQKMWGRFADNVAVIIHVLCSCPLNEMELVFSQSDTEWAELKIEGAPPRELRMILRDIFIHLHYSPNTATLALIYLYRYFGSLKDCQSTDLRVIIGALVLSNKFHDEQRVSLKRWSSLSHISIPELIQSELQLLESLDWDAYISPSVFYYWGQVMHRVLKAGVAERSVAG